MKKHNSKNIVFPATMLALACTLTAKCQTTSSTAASDPIVDALIEKGILNASEAQKIQAEIAARQTNHDAEITQMSASRFKISDSIKSMNFFGDARLRYEYRGADNVAGGYPNTLYRERFRYALRFGVRGDLFDDFNYGIRLETSTNPRSPWDTFGSGGTAGTVTPSDKSTSGINLGQVYLGWHPTTWYEMTVGRMPMPLYTTPMMWDSDINPEGAFEKFKYSVGDVDLFADFGQFDYQDPSSAGQSPSGDTFILAWQFGANVKIDKNSSFKIAPVLYTYTGVGQGGTLNTPFVGQGNATGGNPGVPGGSNVAGYNEAGINDLLILEIPFEYNYKFAHTPVGPLQARLFGDFAYNIDADERATAAYHANPAAFPGVSGPATGEDMAYQIGVGIGSAGPVYGPTQGLVYGSTSKKNTWEARVYWQHVEQYALDVNLVDSDFFEGRGNLEGIYTAFAYSFTDSIIGTVRYGHATEINNKLGTGGSNLDLPGINPVRNYNVLQLDLTCRF